MIAVSIWLIRNTQQVVNWSRKVSYAEIGFEMLNLNFKHYIYLVSVFFTIICSLGITNSSIGILSEDQMRSGILIGEPQPVRSDEYLRWSAELVHQIKYNQSANILEENDLEKKLFNFQLNKNLIKFLSDTDQYFLIGIGRYLPIDVTFALLWWYPVFLCFIFIPALLLKLNIRPVLNIATPFLLFITPTNLWWTNAPFSVLGVSSAGAYFGIQFFDFKLKTITLHGNLFIGHWINLVLSAIYLSKLPFMYQVWSIPAIIFFGLIIFGYLIQLPINLKSKVELLTHILLLFLVSFSLKLFLKFPIIQSLRSTEYPGERRITESGSFSPIYSSNLHSNLLGAFGKLNASNQSELSYTYMELGLLIISLFPLLIKYRNQIQNKAIIFFSIFFIVVFHAWAALKLPKTINNFLAPLSIFPPDRIAQFLGLLSMITFIVIIGSIKIPSDIKSNINIFLFGAFTLLFLIIYRDNLDYLSYFSDSRIKPKEIYFSIIVFLISIYFISLRNKIYPLVSILLLINLFGSLKINPVQMGLNPLINSDLSTAIAKLETKDPGPWISNAWFVDTLIHANVKETITGQQNSGPEISKWEIIDPDMSYKKYWNRGASYIQAEWIESGNQYITSPAFDIIKIHINPCDREIYKLKIKYVVSDINLNEKCLIQVDNKSWRSSEYWIYKVSP